MERAHPYQQREAVFRATLERLVKRSKRCFLTVSESSICR